MWDLWWTKWHWYRFFLKYFGLSFQLHSTGALLHGKMKKKRLMLFIIGLQNKPQGCGASVASAVTPLTTKKKTVHCIELYII
jgi:hypothetical protein